MPPIVRAVGYYITFFGGLLISSLSAGFVAAGWPLEQYPIWLKIALGAWPIWTAAFGLTAASHTPVKEEVITPIERNPGYVPDRVLVEDEPLYSPPPGQQFMTSSTAHPEPIEVTHEDEFEDAHLPSNQPELTDPETSTFFRDEPDDTLHPGEFRLTDVEKEGGK